MEEVELLKQKIQLIEAGYYQPASTLDKQINWLLFCHSCLSDKTLSNDDVSRIQVLIHNIRKDG